MSQLILHTLSGETEPLTDFDDFKRTLTVNGDYLITFTIDRTDKNAKQFDQLVNKNKLELDEDTFVIDGMERDPEGGIITKSMTARHEMFDRLYAKFVGETYTAQKSLQEWMGIITDGTGLDVQITGDFASEQFDNFGNAHALDMFKDVIDRFGVEYRVYGLRLVIAKQIGIQRDAQFRHGHNLKTFSDEFNTDNLVTQVTALGKNDDNGNPTVSVTVKSPNWDKFERIYAITVQDERYTQIDSLTAYAEAQFNEGTYSAKAEFIELVKNGLKLHDYDVGDSIWCIYDKGGMDLDLSVRIISQDDYPFDKSKSPVVTLGTEQANITTSFTAAVSETKDLVAQAKQQANVALVQANGKNKNFYSDTEPTSGMIAGDIWFEKINGQYLRKYHYDGTQWVLDVSEDANDAMNKAIDALTAANGKNTVYHQSAQPAAGNEDDIWFRENADGTITQFIYQSGQWVDPIDSGVKAAQDAADTAQAAASNAQASADTAATVASNALSVGSAAQTAADNAASAASDAQNAANAAQTAAESAMSQALAANDAALAAQTSADGKSTISYGSTAPSNPKNGDTWFKDNGNGTTTIQQYVNGSWMAPTDAATKSAQAAANAAQTAANNAASAASAAQTTANSASSAASAAQTTANGRNRILRQSTTPTGTFVTGDTWFDTANGNRVSVWTGSAWSLSQFGNAAVANLDAGAITTGTLAANRIAAGSIDVSKLVAGTLTSASGVFGTMDASVINAGTLNAARIGTGSIDATKIATGAITATNGIIASIDASKITVGTLSSDRIGAQSITANQIAIGDFTNLAVINEATGTNINNQWTTTAISSGWITVSDAHGNSFFMFCDQTPSIPFEPNDTLRFEFNAIATTASTVTFSTWVYPSVTGTGGNLSTSSSSFTIGTTESTFTGTVKVPNFSRTFQSFVLGLQGADPKANGIKVRSVKVYRMNAGNLIVDGAITASKIAASSIDASKIVAGTLTSASGVFGSVDASILTTGTLNAARIAAKSIDASKLVAGTLTSASGVFGTMDASVINAGTLNAARIGAGTIDASKLVAGTITAASGVISSIDAGKITTGTLDTNRIAAGSITANKLDVANLAAISANLGAVTAGTLTGVSINAATFTGGTYTGGKFTAYGVGYGNDNQTVTIGNTPAGTIAPINIVSQADSTNSLNIYASGIGFNKSSTGGDSFSNYLHSGFDKGDLSEENNVNIRTWQGFSISPSISGQKIQQFHPAFSVNARTGDLSVGGDIAGNNIHGDHIIVRNTNNRMVLQSGGEIYVADATNTSFVPIRASAFNVQSTVDSKQDIVPMTESALDILNATDVYNFHYIADVEAGRASEKYGVVIGYGYRTPTALLNYDKNAVDLYNANFINTKAIQELFQQHQQDAATIAQMQLAINNLQNRVQALEAA